jgi:hypothetical protein
VTSAPLAGAGYRVAARAECGGFLTVEDLFSMADISMVARDTVRDRGVVIPPTS